MILDDALLRLSHGENRGSSPLGSASKIKYILKIWPFVSNGCPINICGQAWTPALEHRAIRAVARLRNRTDISCGLKVLAGRRPALLEWSTSTGTSEHQTTNLGVGGSNPSGRATRNP